MSDTGQAGPADYTIQRLTTFSPIRPKLLGSLRRGLAFVAWTPGVGRPLLELSTIHYARWIIISSLPDPYGADKRWQLNWNYLVFQGVYDGPSREYLDTFGDLVPLRIARLFGTCFGFESRVEDAPGAGDQVFPMYAFRAFVAANSIRELGSYDHSPESVRVVRQALAIERAEHGVDSGEGSVGRAQSEVESLALGAPLVEPSWRESLLGPSIRRARPSHSVNPLTIVAPLRQDADFQILRDMESVPRALFATSAVIPRTMKAGLGQTYPDALPCDYLLFTSDFYGDMSGCVDAMRAHSSTERIFQQCVGFPGSNPWDFRRWIARHSVHTQYYLCGYPPRPAAELRRILATRRAIADDLATVAVREEARP